jgi:UDP-glucuronate decarboxylase
VNLGNPEECTVRALAERVIDITGSRSRIVHAPLPADDPTQRRPSIELAERALGRRPTVTMSEGLPRTVAYFERLLSGADHAARRVAG